MFTNWTLVERVRCFCYLAVFNTSNPGCLIFFCLGFPGSLIVLIFNSLKKSMMFFPPWISCVPGGQDNLVSLSRVHTDLQFMSCMLRFILEPLLPSSFLPALLISPGRGGAQVQGLQGYEVCFTEELQSPKSKNNFL